MLNEHRSEYLAEETNIFLPVLHVTFPPPLPGERCQAPSSLELVAHKERVPQGWSPQLRADQDSLNLIKKENNLHSKR